jgi:hypothetical protein
MIHKIKENNILFSYKNYSINGTDVRIKVKHFETNNQMVYSHHFRSVMKDSDYKMTPICIKSENDFFQDMDFIFLNLKEKDLSKQSMWDVYFTIIGNHIDNYGRLIDTDLEGYLDSISKAMGSISNTLGMPISDIDGAKIRADFRKSSFQIFANHIWINRKSNILNPMSNVELIKYTDIVH